MPPFAFTSSTAIETAFLLDSPKVATSPVIGNTAPILIVSDSAAGCPAPAVGAFGAQPVNIAAIITKHTNNAKLFFFITNSPFNKFSFISAL